MDPAVILIIIVKLLLVVLLVALNGFFVAAEFAIVKIRHTQLAPFLQEGQRRALLARRKSAVIKAAFTP